MPVRLIKALILVAGLALCLSACGVRGPLEPPPNASTAEGDAPLAGEEKPHRRFILDGLLD